MLTVTRRTRGQKEQGGCDIVERTNVIRDASQQEMHDNGTEDLADSERAGLRLHQHMDPRGLQPGRAGRRDHHEDGIDANARCC